MRANFPRDVPAVARLLAAGILVVVRAPLHACVLARSAGVCVRARAYTYLHIYACCVQVV